MPLNKVAIVAPVHIPVSQKWIDALLKEPADVIIVDDSAGDIEFPDSFEVYDYARQEKEMGKDLYKQFEQFHRSAACKNFGTWLAYKQGYDVIIVIDSDCIVNEGFVQEHLIALSTKGIGWLNPLRGTGFYSRGFPYSKRSQEKWCHMGLWTNELDLYGTDRVGKTDIPKEPKELFDAEYNAPYAGRGAPAHFPLSGMNVSFKREAIPYMLFLPNFDYGEPDNFYGFRRHDDIWGGYIFQKIAHAKNKALSYVHPYVFHDTVVVPEEDAVEEVAMIKYEDDFYNFIDRVSIELWQEDSAFTIFDTLAYMAIYSDEFSGLKEAFQFWADAFKDL